MYDFDFQATVAEISRYEPEGEQVKYYTLEGVEVEVLSKTRIKYPETGLTQTVARTTLLYGKF